ncbi:MAG: response regulator [Candidatus Eremiobacteraeota bacterium]|nr:response regulator [Candidatus Eremiobacteraeota bacterium]MCW5866983.1 response regulator [Candidatus Eremiobacteraeota bacterium]
MSQSILIVEDAADLRNMYKMLFRRKPYGVHLAASGEEALEILGREADIALVLLDLTLPGISGEQVLEKVRQNPERSSIKFLLMSGWDDLKQRAAALGAEGFSRKPAVLPELEKQVEALLGVV